MRSIQQGHALLVASLGSRLQGILGLSKKFYRVLCDVDKLSVGILYEVLRV